MTILIILIMVDSEVPVLIKKQLSHQQPKLSLICIAINNWASKIEKIVTIYNTIFRNKSHDLRCQKAIQLNLSRSKKPQKSRIINNLKREVYRKYFSRTFENQAAHFRYFQNKLPNPLMPRRRLLINQHYLYCFKQYAHSILFFSKRFEQKMGLMAIQLKLICLIHHQSPMLVVG